MFYFSRPSDEPLQYTIFLYIVQSGVINIKYKIIHTFSSYIQSFIQVSDKLKRAAHEKPKFTAVHLNTFEETQFVLVAVHLNVVYVI